MKTKGHNRGGKRIIVGATGASGLPILVKCLELIGEQPEYESYLIMSHSAVLTLGQETDLSAEQVEGLADYVLGPDEIGAGPASGSFATEGMLIVPCSMKTIAGIHGGYAENLILRAADVTIKEQRTLVLAARETPLSPIHLRNMYELSMMPGVRVIPPMMTFYHRPENMEEMIYHIASKLLDYKGTKGTVLFLYGGRRCFFRRGYPGLYPGRRQAPYRMYGPGSAKAVPDRKRNHKRNIFHTEPDRPQGRGPVPEAGGETVQGNRPGSGVHRRLPY